MTTLIISNGTPYGSMTNQATSRLIALNTMLERLKDAIATAASGYEGTPGTEYELSTGLGTPANLFGVTPSETPGEQGTAYSYAMGRLNEEWSKFWTAAEPFIEQLDNGSGY